jgi:hypothetical protein
VSAEVFKGRTVRGANLHNLLEVVGLEKRSKRLLEEFGGRRRKGERVE